MTAPPPLSILVIAASPDDRRSSATLRVIVDEFERRQDVRHELWMLRVGPGRTAPTDARVIDELRSWPVANTLRRLGVPRLPDLLRGLRLRAWNRAAAPDLVILDDGVGDRALVGTPGSPVLAARINEVASPDMEMEPSPSRRPDLLVAPAGHDGDGVPVLATPDVLDCTDPRAAADPVARERARSVLGLPSGVPLVVGWGSDGWLDGPDVFVRALWALERHEGVVAHGLWLGLGADVHEVDRLMAEAERCGLAGRFHCRSGDTLAARCAGDVVFLPYRSPGDPQEVLSAVASGLVVVTFPSCPVDDPAVTVVGHLDVDAAAVALAAGMATDRTALAAAAEQRFGVGPWVDRLLSTVREFRRS